MEQGLRKEYVKSDFSIVWEKLSAMLKEKGVPVFAVIDHKANAEKAHLTMPETKVVIFGNPAAGTPLMLAAPAIALDLPLKIAVQEEKQGTTIRWIDPAWLAQRHALGSNDAMRKVSAFVNSFTQELISGL